MKKIKNIFKVLTILLIIAACTDNLRDISFVDNIAAPSNVSATFNITQDNTGVVTLSPTADGASNFEIYFGDGTAEPAKIAQGESTQHTYAEGTYDVKVVAFNTKGDKTEAIIPLMVSFRAPENLMVTIDNDAAVSKKVNVTATADFATMYEFHSGETGVNQPVATANIGDVLSYQYANPGTYSVKIVAKGGAIATTEHTEDFTVTEILAPIASATTPPSRGATDVISIYSDAGYANVAGTDTFPDWGQGGQGSSWAEFDLNGDKVLQYINLSYQGIQFGSAQDVSGMEFLHLDVWTADSPRLETSLISLTNGEKAVWSDLTADAWTSIDIPLSEFTSQGLTIADIHQLKFVGDSFAAGNGAEGTVFIDNVYFYRAPSSTVTQTVEDFEGTAPTFTHFGNIAPIEVVANPDATGANTSTKVAKMLKTSGSEVWAGAFFDVTTPLDVVNFNKVSIKTWSPKSGATVRFKIENTANNAEFFEIDATTSATNAWEELTFDITNANQAFTYDRVVIFFDFGNAGDDSVYYYDEINLVNDINSGPAPLVFQDFEGTAPAFTHFGNIAAIEVVANPDATGVNTSANVAKMLKTSGSEVWAGAFFDITTPLDVNTYGKVTVKTWSPKSGATVRFKIENSANNAEFFEIDATTSTTNSWEELTFDISGANTAFTYDRVVIFFDFGNAGDDSIYYYDDFTLTN